MYMDPNPTAIKNVELSNLYLGGFTIFSALSQNEHSEV